MAKGNMLLGYSRGSIGDVTFARVKGQQVAKARNRMPNNPRSEKQMLNRSTFVTPCMFYARGLQAQFKFAFENKTSVESDFNAFMRVNSKLGIPVTPLQRQDANFPALGKYFVSYGSLTALDVAIDKGFAVVCPTIKVDNADAIETIGQLSAAIINKYGLSDGDILTAYCISGGVIKGSLLEAGTRVWNVKQIMIDTTSTQLLSDLNISVSTGEVEGATFESIGVAKGAAVGVGVIVSRVTTSGLKVSTSQILFDEQTQKVYDALRTDAYRMSVAAEWNAAGKAILQGSLVNQEGGENTPVGPTEFKVTSATIDGQSVSVPFVKTISVAQCTLVLKGALLNEYDLTSNKSDIKVTRTVATSTSCTYTIMSMNYNSSDTADLSINGFKVGTITIDTQNLG